ncbi:hypothetical protein YC2023_084110 [Brassica napus]
MRRCEQSRRRRARVSPASENVEGLSFSITMSERKLDWNVVFEIMKYIYFCNGVGDGENTSISQISSTFDEGL